MTDPKVVVDTNVVSYIMRGHTLAEAYAPHLEGRLSSITFVTVGELYYGAEKRKWGIEKRKLLETTLRNFVVIPYDHEIAKTYGRILAESERFGNAVNPLDAWIAACAVRHNVPLVTHDYRDFKGIAGLSIITEYKET